MSLNVNNVHIGPMRVWLNVTNPTTGTPPTAMAHTAGVPATGDEVGYTQGDAIFRKTNDVGEVMAEQATGPIAVFLKGEKIEVEFTTLEHTYQTLKATFDNVGNQDSGGRTIMYGGSASPYGIRTQSVMFSSLRPNFAGKYVVGLLYRAYSVNGFEAAFSRTKEATVKVILRALYDSARNDGDQYFQYYQEY